MSQLLHCIAKMNENNTFGAPWYRDLPFVQHHPTSFVPPQLTLPTTTPLSPSKKRKRTNINTTASTNVSPVKKMKLSSPNTVVGAGGSEEDILRAAKRNNRRVIYSITLFFLWELVYDISHQNQGVDMRASMKRYLAIKKVKKSLKNMTPVLPSPGQVSQTLFYLLYLNPKIPPPQYNPIVCTDNDKGGGVWRFNANLKELSTNIAFYNHENKIFNTTQELCRTPHTPEYHAMYNTRKLQYPQHDGAMFSWVDTYYRIVMTLEKHVQFYNVYNLKGIEYDFLGLNVNSDNFIHCPVPTKQQ